MPISIDSISYTKGENEYLTRLNSTFIIEKIYETEKYFVVESKLANFYEIKS